MGTNARPKTPSEPQPAKRRWSRRKVLAAASLALPAAVGALAGGGAGRALGAAKPDGSPFPGDPRVWRRRFLDEARRAPSTAIRERPQPVLADALLPPTAPAGTRAAAASTHVSPVLRMQDELRRAMAKPVNQRKWIMVIDSRKCVGCSACTIACIAENHLPPGVVYMPVLEQEIGEYPNVTRRFMPHHCMQCDDPPCVPVCPVTATYKRPDGIVEIDYGKCIGCRYCIAACPYNARYFDFGRHYTDGTPARQAYEEAPAPEYGRSWQRGAVEGVTRKCHFCLHRLEAGMLPACIVTCIGEAVHFGDKNEPGSLVNELIVTGRAIRHKEELGTEPKVYYLL